MSTDALRVARATALGDDVPAGVGAGADGALRALCDRLRRLAPVREAHVIVKRGDGAFEHLSAATGAVADAELVMVARRALGFGDVAEAGRLVALPLEDRRTVLALRLTQPWSALLKGDRAAVDLAAWSLEQFVHARRATSGRTAESQLAGMASRLHHDVIQPLFGASLMLGREGGLPAGDRASCHRAVMTALERVRAIIEAPADHAAWLDLSLEQALADAQRRLASGDVHIDGPWHAVPGALVPLLTGFVAEATLNVAKHAAPTRVDIWLELGATVDACVRNDGALPRLGRHGSGLSLLRREVAQLGGSLRAGSEPGGGWVCSISIPR